MRSENRAFEDAEGPGFCPQPRQRALARRLLTFHGPLRCWYGSENAKAPSLSMGEEKEKKERNDRQVNSLSSIPRELLQVVASTLHSWQLPVSSLLYPLLPLLTPEPLTPEPLTPEPEQPAKGLGASSGSIPRLQVEW